MKPITEEQRQALIADCKEQIEIIKNLILNGSYAEGNYNLDRQLLVQEIALASLTAEAKAYSDLEELSFPYATSDMWPDPLGFGRDIALYTTPSVPVIKLPEKLNSGEIQYLMSEKYGIDISIGQLETGLANEVWNACINEIKRLNGLED